MGLDFTHVVSDIVNLMEMPIGYLSWQDIFEGFASEMG
jgi:hypothetical protein